MMHLILEKVNHNIMFYDLSKEVLISFADALARKGVPDTVKLFLSLMLRNKLSVGQIDIKGQCIVGIRSSTV